MKVKELKLKLQGVDDEADVVFQANEAVEDPDEEGGNAMSTFACGPVFEAFYRKAGNESEFVIDGKTTEREY